MSILDEKSAVSIAGGTNKQFTPYYYKKYERPEKIKKVYPEPGINFSTPAFIKQNDNFTTHSEMMHFLEELSKNQMFVQLHILGKSLEGREIPYLLFSNTPTDSMEFKDKLTILYQAQIHGNEPAAGESLLVLAEKIAKSSELEEVLKSINIIILPCINPDSTFYFQRLTTKRVNGNRDYVSLETIEVELVQSLINQYCPEVVIDCHEYGAKPPLFEKIGEEGVLKYNDILLLAGNNINVPSLLKDISEKLLISPIFKKLKEENYSHDHYFTVTNRTEEEKSVIYEGGTDVSTGRNALALKSCISLLVESLGIGIGRESFKRRVYGQLLTQEVILKQVIENVNELKANIESVRENISNMYKYGSEVALSSKLTNLQTTLEVLDIATQKPIKIPVSKYVSKNQIALQQRKLPKGYLLPPAFHNIAKKLTLLGANVSKLESEKTLDVETYMVTKKVITNVYGTPLSNVQTEIETKSVLFPKGSYSIGLDNPSALLIALALEPESEDSFVSKNIIASEKGMEIPIYRLINNRM